MRESLIRAVLKFRVGFGCRARKWGGLSVGQAGECHQSGSQAFELTLWCRGERWWEREK